MWAKLDKKRIALYSLCVLLFIVAGILQYIDEDLPMFSAKICNLIANLIFFVLIFLWGISIKNRIVDKPTKIRLLTAAGLIFFWFLIRYIKYDSFGEKDTAGRYLWYLYYVPQCFVPPIALITALGIIRKNKHTINKWLYLIFIPAFVFTSLILTNDLHQLVFSFRNNFENFSSDYRHEIIYYMTMGWIILSIISFIAVLFFKCSISACKKRIWIPICVFIICGVTSFLCFLFATRSYKIPELISFSFILILESCIFIGLIPSNENYEKYFAISDVSSIITNKNIKLIYHSANFLLATKKQCEEAKINGSVFLNENFRLSCKTISGGYVFYLEDLSQINKLLNKLSSINEELLEESEMIIYENELKEKNASLEQKNQLYSKMFCVVSDSIASINNLLDEIDKNSKKYKQNLKIACVYLAYIKRRSNLEVISNGNKTIDINEIILSINESLIYVSDLGIKTSLTNKTMGKFDSNICILLYEFFQMCVKFNLSNMSNIHVQLISLDDYISISILMNKATHSFIDFKNDDIKKFNGKINILKNAEGLYETLTLKYGGEDK